MKDLTTWQFVRDRLQEGRNVMLMAVTESHGASPGKAGFKMVVSSDGSLFGSIGGGIMEKNWVEKSRAMLTEDDPKPIARRLFHTAETVHEKSGLICAGSQAIVLQRFLASDASMAHSIVETIERKDRGILRISSKGYSFRKGESNRDVYHFKYSAEADWEYEETIGSVNTVYVVGSGHVGLALSRIMATLDFYVVVIDHRADVETFAVNTYAHKKIVSPYEEIDRHIAGGPRDYVALVTTAYRCDEAALRQVLTKDVRYIGMMGSPAKTKQIYDDLKREGITDEQLKRVHTPIGVSIYSHTPEEIAISIAAEIIKIKNEPR